MQNSTRTGSTKRQRPRKESLHSDFYTKSKRRAPSPEQSLNACSISGAVPIDESIVGVDWNALLSDDTPNEAFPVDFNALWPALGYSRKDSALRALTHQLVENEDFQTCSAFLWSDDNDGHGGQNRMDYWLSMDGAKHLCLQAGTKKGRAIRRYFIEAEKAWRTERERLLTTALHTAQQDADMTRAAFASRTETPRSRRAQSDHLREQRLLLETARQASALSPVEYA